MLRYLLKRILIFIPTLIAITLVAFMISLNAPGDPVLQMMNGGPNSNALEAERQASEKEYLQKREDLGLNLPVFYFSLTTLGQTDTLHHIPKKYEREMLERITGIYGNWDQISTYYYSLKHLDSVAFSIPQNRDNSELLLDVKNNLISLKREHKASDIEFFLRKVDSLSSLHQSLTPLLAPTMACKSQFDQVVSEKENWKTLMPWIHFYGTKNQYHRWFVGIFFHFDFGRSYQDHREISSIIPERLKWDHYHQSICHFSCLFDFHSFGRNGSQI